jgi:hypothetical protein
MRQNNRQNAYHLFPDAWSAGNQRDDSGEYHDAVPAASKEIILLVSAAVCTFIQIHKINIQITHIILPLFSQQL